MEEIRELLSRLRTFKEKEFAEDDFRTLGTWMMQRIAFPGELLTSRSPIAIEPASSVTLTERGRPAPATVASPCE